MDDKTKTQIATIMLMHGTPAQRIEAVDYYAKILGMPPPMDKVEQLLIRACLASNPKQRLSSVRRRFYITCPQDTMYLAYKLAAICDKYLKISVTEVVEGLESISYKDLPYYDRVLMFCIHKIRHSKKSLFPGLTPPLKFRNKEHQS